MGWKRYLSIAVLNEIKTFSFIIMHITLAFVRFGSPLKPISHQTAALRCDRSDRFLRLLAVINESQCPGAHQIKVMI